MKTWNRREMLSLAGAGAAALVLQPLARLAADTKAAGFTLPKLPYAYDALEPHIDMKTMQIHHDKHHQAYITSLNAALKDHPDLLKMPIDDLLRAVETAKVPKDLKPAVIKFGGGHGNHSLFWEIMGPKAPKQPSGPLAKAITSNYGSFDKFQKTFSQKAITLFGSGWAWLAVDKGKLVIDALPNQISPLMTGKTPIMGIDVWEHAYYLKYQNMRPNYVEAWWNVVNWPAVEARYAKAMKG